MVKNIYRKNNGFAMVTVVILFAVIMIISASALSITMQQSRMNTRYAETIDAIHFAEVGINEYMWHLNKPDADEDDLEMGKNITFGDGKYRLEYLEGSVEDGYARIRSTGFHKDSPDSIRTIEAVISKKSFTEYVWITETEDSGPRWSDKVWNISIHTWNGPFHTNHNINISGSPTFNGPVTYVNEIVTDNWDGTPNPEYNSGEPRQVEEVPFPESNSELIDRAKENGHFYDGMTAIYLKGDKYDVRTYNRSEGEWYFNPVDPQNPQEEEEHRDNEKPEERDPLPLPENGVIYVDGAGSTQWSRNTGDIYISGEVDGELTIAGANNIYITGYDPTDWREPDNPGGNPRYEPQGQYTGGIKYLGGINDDNSLFGLIAENNVELLNHDWPRVSESNNNNWSSLWWKNIGDIAPYDITLHGAYFALNGSIKYDRIQGINKGDLNLFGSFAQNVRGAISTGGVGYGRNFEYDERLLYQEPPYFLEPVDTGWEINEWREVSQHVPES